MNPSMNTVHGPPADTVITVQYTEGGSASSAGGPWTVFIDGFIV